MYRKNKSDLKELLVIYKDTASTNLKRKHLSQKKLILVQSIQRRNLSKSYLLAFNTVFPNKKYNNVN